MLIPKYLKNQSIIHYFDAQSPLLKYGLAVLAVAIATLATHYISILGERAVFLLFFFAIIQVAFWLGQNPGLLAMVLSLLTVNTLSLFPDRTLNYYDIATLNVGFCGLSIAIIATTSLHRTLTTALWENQQRYFGIVESAMDAIITIGADQRILLFNAAAEKMFACTADQAIGLSIDLFIPELLSTAQNQPINSGESCERMSDVLGLRANGEEVTIEATLSHCEIDGKKSITVILRDVAARKRAEEEHKLAEEKLRASEEFMRGVLNALPEHIVVLDEHGRVSTVNEPWQRSAFENDGSLCEVSIGDNYLDVCRRSAAAGDCYAQEALAGMEDLLAGYRQEFVMEYPCLTAKRKLWFLMHAKRVLHDPKGVILSHVDITEHKQGEEKLRETQARLALVIEAVKAGYWDWDLNTRTLYLSPECKQQIGFDENELLNHWQEWECRLHPDDQAMVLDATKNYIAGRQVAFELEFRLLHKNSSYRWIHSRGALLRDQNNQAYRMLGINLDISDYVKTKELSERRKKMEQSFRSSVAVQTAAAIAHELNQPLTAITSYADVALHMLNTGNFNSQKLSDVIEHCSQQAQRAGQVIRQLLTLLQKGEAVSEPLDINGSVREALEFVEADGYLGEFKINLDLTPNLPSVAANGLQIQKVLVNLLRNSIEAMQESKINAGTMNITTRSFYDNPAMVQVTVSDSGKGVADAASLRAIFQPFYTTKSTGLGMGLAISRTLIEAHGGKMWAEQNAGLGISIHFTLPFVI